MNRYLVVFLSLLLFSANSYGQCLPNIGFELGDFSYWETFSGTGTGDNTYHFVNFIPTPGYQYVISRSTAGTDPIGGFSLVPPDGSKYCIQLNDEEIHDRAARISYTFIVPQNMPDFKLIYYYALVLENTTHPAWAHPTFTAAVVDLSDNSIILCDSARFIPGEVGFNVGPGDSYYRTWTPATINLRGMQGKKLKLEFTARGCLPGAHYGYAYLDINETCFTSGITGNTYCAGQQYLRLTAPPGFSFYNWFNAADPKTIIDVGNTITVKPAPPAGTRYGVQIIPFNTGGCPDTLYTTINAISTNFKFNVADSVVVCPSIGSVDLTAPAITTGTSPGTIFGYYTDPDCYLTVESSTAIKKSGTYYIKGTNPDGCSNILPIRVLIRGPIIHVVNPAAVTYPDVVDISTTFKHVDTLTYSYFKDAKANIPLVNYTAVQRSATDYINVTDKAGCSTIAPVRVIIKAPPSPEIILPNTFTPNNDGVNDVFKVTIKGFATFNRLQVFDRNGALIFTSTDVYTGWDGTYKGKNLPVGTYYWLFNGVDNYLLSTITRSGSITLLR